MRKQWLAAFVLGTVLAAAPAGAVSIALLPSTLSASVGDAVDLDVVVSGLGAGVDLGSYDLTASFDPSLLSFDSLDFGTFLGGPADSLQGSVPSAGQVELAEVSLLSPADLAALQPDSFTLATLHFTVAAAGTSSVGFVQALVGDAFGRPLDVTLGGARIVGGEAAVPEPGALGLFALGALAVLRRPRSPRLR